MNQRILALLLAFSSAAFLVTVSCGDDGDLTYVNECEASCTLSFDSDECDAEERECLDICLEHTNDLSADCARCVYEGFEVYLTEPGAVCHVGEGSVADCESSCE